MEIDWSLESRVAMVTRRLEWADCLYQAAALGGAEDLCEWAEQAAEDIEMCAALLDEASAGHEMAKADFVDMLEEEDALDASAERARERIELADEVDRWLRTGL